MIRLLIILVFLVVVVSFVLALVRWFSTKGDRTAVKDSRRQVLTLTVQRNMLRESLIKIAAQDCGSPWLEAALALAELSKIELKELES